MELIIKDIKESLACCSPKEIEERITIWRNQFRQQGISIIALETLLNFYREPHVIEGGQSEDDFVSFYSAMHSSESDENQQVIRSEIDKLRREKKELQKQISKWRKYSLTILIISIVVIIIMCIVFFIIK